GSNAGAIPGVGITDPVHGIFVTDGDLFIQSTNPSANIHNTILNSGMNKGHVGVGTNSPTAKLDMVLPSLNYAEAGIRITAPNMFSLSGSGSPGPVLMVPELFEIRKQTATGGFSTHFIVKTSGNTGIGTDDPKYKLHIKNPATTSGTAVRIDAINGHIRLFETDGSNPESYTQIERNGDAFHIYQRDITSTSFVHVLAADMTGNVGFGDVSQTDTKMMVNAGSNSYGIKCIVNNASSKSLAVTNGSDGLDVFRVMGNGVVWCTELNVDVKGDFPDYVFGENYKLMSLDQLKHFIETEKHLPNVPTAKEIAENGIAVSKMAVLQTEKIEELTLYLLQLNESIQELRQQNQALQKRIVELESK
ncbi:MAG TPA: hypothetical protein VD905_15990, partial [Flavobacteriales bacterium]|nr:hypothetical protein [Flavobacteriales bacterium]